MGTVFESAKYVVRADGHAARTRRAQRCTIQAYGSFADAHVFAGAILLAAAPTAPGATVTGIVKDATGKPIENARVDHTGKRVVVAPASVALKPSPDETRTDAEGKFRVVTDVPAIVVRNPGYESQRVPITGDLQLEITLQRIRSTSRCKLSAPPAFKTNDANDVDYTAKWFVIETKDGPQGIISGSGPMYS